VYGLSGYLNLPFLSAVFDETRTPSEALCHHMLEVISLVRARIADGKTKSMDAALLRNLVGADMSYDETFEGSTTINDILALHVNSFIDLLGSSFYTSAIYWGDEVEEFKPERFIGIPDYGMPAHLVCCDFPPFAECASSSASGRQSCIGQRLPVTKVVCILAHLTRRYEIL
jgi:hypothetical protein